MPFINFSFLIEIFIKIRLSKYLFGENPDMLNNFGVSNKYFLTGCLFSCLFFGFLTRFVRKQRVEVLRSSLLVAVLLVSIYFKNLKI